MVAQLDIVLNGDKIWGDDPPPNIVYWDQFTIAAMIDGMASGKPSVGLVARNGDTGYVAETSMVNFLVAADLFNVAYGDPRHMDWTQPTIDDMKFNLKRWYNESMAALGRFEVALKEQE